MVDREPRTTLSDGTQVYPDHRNIIPDGPRKGQQEGYVVLADEERAKGFVRPVRASYKHLKCGGVTTMGSALAETYARDPRGAEALQIEDVPIPAEFDSGSFAFGLIVGFVISALLWGGGLWAGGFYGG